MRILIASLIAIFTFAFVREAQSCECGDTRAATCFKDASVIFEGEVLSMQIRTHALLEGMTLTKQTTTEHTVFTLKVGRVYKGAPPKTVRVATGIGTSDGSAAPDCSFPFEIGRRYLVYGYSEIRENGGLLATSICTGTNLISEAGRYLRHLQGKLPTKEDMLREKYDWEGLSKLEALRATAQISGKIDGMDKERRLESRIWRFSEGEWNQYGFPYIVKDNIYTADRLEPGEYRIGFFQILDNDLRRIGFCGGAERLEEARSIIVGSGSHINNIDIKLKPQSRHVVLGKIECSDGHSPNGKIKIRIANSWDLYKEASVETKPCGSFQIPDAYSGKFRVIATLEPDTPGPLDAWTISVPEIMVPEEAGNVVLKLKPERMSERATSLSYKWGEVWTGKVRRVLDGDKIVVEVDGARGKARTLRIANIICPRKGQRRWEEARRLTEKLMLGKTEIFYILRNEVNGRSLEYEDSHGIRVGLPVDTAKSTAAELIKAGLAWHYTKYSADPELARLEVEARKARRGIWAEMNPQLRNQSQR
jgi:endonuclease YncB( thermonuclease family)